MGSVPGRGTKNPFVEPSAPPPKKKKTLKRSISGTAFTAELFFTCDRIHLGLRPCDVFQAHEKLKHKTYFWEFPSQKYSCTNDAACWVCVYSWFHQPLL